VDKTLFLIVAFIFTLCFNSFSIKKERDIAISDSTQIIIKNIRIGGNKKTKNKIIYRELLFKTGDTIYLELLENYIQKSKDNLLNTSLFNYITITKTVENSNNYLIYILVEERWYLWPYIIFEQADRNLSSFFHNKDWSRINYGIMLVKNNFRGQAETVKFKARLGYKQQFQIAYEIPYIGKSRQHGLSAEFSWNRQHEIAYNTINDQLVYYKNEQDFAYTMENMSFRYQFRRKHYLKHNFLISHSYNQVLDTVILLNSNYFDTKKTTSQYLSLGYIFDLDKRNYRQYPLKGYNFELVATQRGLNILPNEINGIWELEANTNYYFDYSNRWYSGFGFRGKISSNRKQPFFIEQSLGYRSTLRAYEYYVIDGQYFATGRAFMKYAIIPMNIHHIESWNWNKFNKIHYSLYVNAFFDSGYVYDINPNITNKLPNTFLASTGIGIDLVAYYDQILRFEYSINRLGKHGFFIHIGKAF